MKTLIVYDSFFGNTEQIARVIGTRACCRLGQGVGMTGFAVKIDT